MTLAALVKQARYLPTLYGAECTRAFRSYSSMLNLFFGALGPPDEKGFLNPERSLTVETSWRLETSSQVLVGSGDENATIGERVQVVVGQRVQDTQVFLPSYMVRLAFGDELVLWVFPDDARDYGVARPNPMEPWEYPNAPWFVMGPDVPEGWE